MSDDLRRNLHELPPPSLDVPHDFFDRVMGEARHRRRVKLAGSSAVAAVVAAALVFAGLSLSSDTSTDRVIPIRPAPTAAMPTPSPTASPTPTPSDGTTTPSAPPASTPTEAPSTSTATLGGATLTLPAGWVAEAIPSTANVQQIVPTWCLMPHSALPPTSPDALGCTIAFKAVPTTAAGSGLSVDTPGGLLGNPDYCPAPDSQTVSLLRYEDTTFGARPADYRDWLYTCHDGTSWPVEQYVADNAPGYVLYSSHATSSVHAVLTDIAKTAQLPTISAPLRLSDLGIIRTLIATAGGYRLTLDRVVRGPNGLINNNPQTYAYDVPTAAIPNRETLQVGDLVQIITNGTAVTRAEKTA